MVEAWLGPALAEVFFSQPRSDQRHGYEAAETVMSGTVAGPDVVLAALLHDVGKRHARLGLIGRSISSLVMKLRLPLRGRMASYRDHGTIAAGELAEIGAPPLAVAFALHHHGERPESIQPEVWEILQLADQPPKAATLFIGRITSKHT